ncbi:MAG: DNA polymerase IV, partial [Deltaproteobacteria bacterium]|nr:DNA polymerase IV [Deltaproteobacteria bacterium]
KPDGLRVVSTDEARAFLHALPVTRLFGVGKVTGQTLERLGVSTIGDLAALPPKLLIKRCGKVHGEQLYRLAQGDDDRPVVPDQLPKSIGHEDTFEQDIEDEEELRAIVRQQTYTACRRMRRQGFLAKTVVVKAKTARFELRTRQRALTHASGDDTLIAGLAEGLLCELVRELRAPLRLTGVTCTDLCFEETPRQLTFDEPQRERGERLTRTLDRIADRFGEDIVARGVPPKTKRIRDRS